MQHVNGWVVIRSEKCESRWRETGLIGHFQPDLIDATVGLSRGSAGG
jgi:hypothetical protein